MKAQPFVKARPFVKEIVMGDNNVHVLYVLTKLELGGAQKVCLTLLKGVNNSSLVSGTEGVLVPEAKKLSNSKENSSVYLLKSLKREVGIATLFYEFSTFFKMISLMRKLKKEHKKLVVHTHSTKAGLMGRWAAFFAGVKKRVHTVHGFGFHEHQSKIGYFINYSLEYITSLITTHYVCVSNADRNIGKKSFPHFGRKSSIIRAAVDWDPFAKGTTFTGAVREKQNFVFGTVSCLKPQKNLLDLLKAFKFMHDQLSPENQKRVVLQIMGDGVQRPLIEEWLQENNMQDKVDLLGWQSNVAKWLHTWDVFTMSSLWEGLPCAIVEARLSKLPVISYKIAGIPEVIKNKKNGFLIKPGDWQTLGKKMKLLFEDHELYQQMSNCQEDLTDFHNNSMVEKHVKLYKRL